MRRHVAIWMGCALMLVGGLCWGRSAIAQAATSLTLRVTDSSGSPISGARVLNAAGTLLGRTSADGRATFFCVVPCHTLIRAEGFASGRLMMTGDTSVSLGVAASFQQTTVTAYRTPLGDLESPASTRLLTEIALRGSAAVTMDDKLRELPGVELFRRSSSLVANPTSQGISLRGLGSTSASRTLLTLDDVPLNDPVGGWIHWEEQPDLAVQSVEVVRGGASDLYGSSAIGGVINMEMVLSPCRLYPGARRENPLAVRVGSEDNSGPTRCSRIPLRSGPQPDDGRDPFHRRKRWHKIPAAASGRCLGWNRQNRWRSRQKRNCLDDLPWNRPPKSRRAQQP